MIVDRLKDCVLVYKFAKETDKEYLLRHKYDKQDKEKIVEAFPLNKMRITAGERLRPSKSSQEAAESPLKEERALLMRERNENKRLRRLLAHMEASHEREQKCSSVDKT